MKKPHVFVNMTFREASKGRYLTRFMVWLGCWLIYKAQVLYGEDFNVIMLDEDCP